MARSYFVIMPGLQSPAQFKWQAVPRLLQINDLWAESRSVMSGLLFRVRSDQAAGATLARGDTIESCVGLIDSTSRWRASAGMARMMVSTMRLPLLSQACWNALGLLMNKHPAAIMTPERHAHAAAIREAVDKVEGEGAVQHFETTVGSMVMRLLFVDNDVDAMGAVPVEAAFMVNLPTDGGVVARPVLDARLGSVEVLCASILMSESFGRLCERAPEWLWHALPQLPSAAPASPSEAPSEEAEDEDDPDDEN